MTQSQSQHGVEEIRPTPQVTFGQVEAALRDVPEDRVIIFELTGSHTDLFE